MFDFKVYIFVNQSLKFLNKIFNLMHIKWSFLENC